MKQKIITTLFLLLSFSAITLQAKIAQAQDEPIKFKSQISDFAPQGESLDSGTFLLKYLSAIHKYGIGIIAILATVVMMYGGVVWITAMGNNERINDAKAWIGAALSGLVLALSGYTILYFVNPNLVNLNPIQITKTEPVDPNKEVCCEYDNGGAENTTLQNCTDKNGEIYSNRTADRGKCVNISEINCCEYISNRDPDTTKCTDSSIYKQKADCPDEPDFKFSSFKEHSQCQNNGTCK